MTHRSTRRVAALLVAAGVPASLAQTVTVTTLEDVTDFAGARRVADLPGPDGKVSFREACIAANNTAGPQTIAFAIPTSEWWLDTTLAILKLESGAFLLSDAQTTVDFTTQTAYSGDTNPGGPEVGIYGLEAGGWGTPAIIITGSDCVIRGLGPVWLRGASVGIWEGTRNRVVGCQSLGVEIDGPFGGPATTFHVIGGTAAGEGNTLDFVDITCWADDNTVIGNTLGTVRVAGSTYCVHPRRNRIGGPTPAERNVIANFGYFGEEGFPVGEGIEVNWARDTLIEGNYIGTTPDGSAGAGQTGPTGVAVHDSINTTIRNNLISGLWVEGRNHYAGQRFGQAVLVAPINADNVGTVVEGNRIGTDASGANPILTLNGVVVAPQTSRFTARDTFIGGEGPGQGNTIGFVERRGVAVSSLVADAVISGNSIRASGILGIDLAAASSGYDGVTPNDPGDADTGANGLQNFPVLTGATGTPASTQIAGTLNSLPARVYRVQLFASERCHPTGHGEGERFLGGIDVTTDAAGNAAFDVTLPVGVAVGEFVTATATDVAAGATSEFSACRPVEAGCVADFNGDGAVNTLDVIAYLNAFNAGDPAADINADGTVNSLDLIAFLNLFNAGC